MSESWALAIALWLIAGYLWVTGPRRRRPPAPTPPRQCYPDVLDGGQASLDALYRTRR